MDNMSHFFPQAFAALAEAAAKATDDTEKKFADLNVTNDEQSQQIKDLQLKIIQLTESQNELEAKCQSLRQENIELSSKLDQESKLREAVSERLVNEMGKTRKQIDELHHSQREWQKVLSALAISVESFRRDVEKRTKNLEESYREISHSSTPKRYTDNYRFESSSAHSFKPSVVRSPSASSYLSHHTPKTRLARPKTSYIHDEHKTMNNYAEVSIDPGDELSVISDQADALRHEVEVLNELQRSFERNSVYSEESL